MFRISEAASSHDAIELQMHPYAQLKRNFQTRDQEKYTTEEFQPIEPVYVDPNGMEIRNILKYQKFVKPLIT